MALGGKLSDWWARNRATSSTGSHAGSAGSWANNSISRTAWKKSNSGPRAYNWSAKDIGVSVLDSAAEGERVVHRVVPFGDGRRVQREHVHPQQRRRIDVQRHQVRPAGLEVRHLVDVLVGRRADVSGRQVP